VLDAVHAGDQPRGQRLLGYLREPNENPSGAFPWSFKRDGLVLQRQFVTSSAVVAGAGAGLAGSSPV